MPPVSGRDDTTTPAPPDDVPEASSRAASPTHAAVSAPGDDRTTGPSPASASPPAPGAAGVVVLPRGLIFAATVWLLAAWALTVGFWPPPVQPSSSSYEPGVRLMLLSLAVGLYVAWPMLRLSQAAPSLPVHQTVLDLFVLASMLQVVLWPLQIVTRWSPTRTAAIDLTMLGWLLVVAAIVASTIGTNRRGPRTLGMLACLVLCLAGPLVRQALPADADVEAILPDLLELSPLLLVHRLGDGGGAPIDLLEWRWIGLLGLAGVLAWVAVGTSRAAARRLGAG